MLYLAEDSETLDFALRHCYCIRRLELLTPELSSLRDAQVLLEFARKYNVDATGRARSLADALSRGRRQRRWGWDLCPHFQISITSTSLLRQPGLA